MKCALRFQELQAVLAVVRGCTVEKLQHSDGMKMELEDRDDRESVDAAAIQETVLGM